MKLIYRIGTLNLDNFDQITYRESLLGANEGYPVEAVRRIASGGFLGGIKTIREEIVRFKNVEHSKQLVTDISIAWANSESVFDLNKWIEKHS